MGKHGHGMAWCFPLLGNLICVACEWWSDGGFVWREIRQIFGRWFRRDLEDTMNAPRILHWWYNWELFTTNPSCNCSKGSVVVPMISNHSLWRMISHHQFHLSSMRPIEVPQHFHCSFLAWLWGVEKCGPRFGCNFDLEPSPADYLRGCLAGATVGSVLSIATALAPF